MKRTILTIALLSVALTSCKKKNPQPEPTPVAKSLTGAWVIADCDSLVGTTGTDEDYTNYWYSGDTYCCNVKTVQLSYNSFIVDDTIMVEGHAFKVIDLNETGFGIPDPEEPQVYRYWIALQVVTPQVGKAYSYVLGKRTAD